MNALSLSAVSLACVLLALWAHYAFWTWRLRTATREDEVVFAETDDGWRLALGRRRPRGEAPRGTPVLLVHGLAANRAALDFGVERWSLAAHLSAAGFDCFSLDLRGHGQSRRLRRSAAPDWTFDDYLRHDVPAAIGAIERATGSSRVFWVGHSQGGLLGMAASGFYPEHIEGLVALAAPAFFAARNPLGYAARLILTGRFDRFLARCFAPFSGWSFLSASDIFINVRNVTRPVLSRALANVVEDVPAGVLRQFGAWATQDRFCAYDGSIDYRAAFPRVRVPALFVAASADRIAPPEAVKRAARLWGGAAEVFEVGRAGAACCDYGHSDLLFGRRAPEEVYPRIRDWLLARAAELEAECSSSDGTLSARDVRSPGGASA